MVDSGDTNEQPEAPQDEETTASAADLLTLLGTGDPKVAGAAYQFRDAAPVDLGPPLTRLSTLEHTRTKVSALFSLAEQGYPGLENSPEAYRALAASINRDVDPQILLADFKAAVADPSSLRRSVSGRGLDLHHVAFLGESCTCTTASVTVDGKPATWIFSEFDTDAALGDIITWMQPTNWPSHSPLLFKAMTPTIGPTEIPGGQAFDPAGPPPMKWHGTFIEEVSLIDPKIETSLHFDFVSRLGAFAAISYVLHNVEGNEYHPSSEGDGVINVDRGFLSVNELGTHRHVKALKVVGFTGDRASTDLALAVCPFWTEFVKGAVEQRGAGGLVPTYASCTSDVHESIDDFRSFAGEAFSDYLDTGTRWAKAACAPGYSVKDLTEDSAGAWLQLAQTWTNAWAHSYEVLQSVANNSRVFNPPAPEDFPEGLQPIRPAGSNRSFIGSVKPARPDNVETITIPVAGLAAGAVCSVTDFTRAGLDDGTGPIAPGSMPTIAAAAISVDVVTFGADPGDTPTNGVRLRVNTKHLVNGIYCGEMTHASDGRSVTVPIHFYVSNALEAAT